MERSIKGTGKKSEKAAGDSFGKIGGIIAGAFAADRIAAFAMKVIEVRGEFEKFGAVLTNTLGSGSEADEALNMIQDFAAKTPFSVMELTDSFVRLANQGFTPTRKEMVKLGDLAASTGKGFNQLAEAVLDAQVGEFERLKEFGIRAQAAGDKVIFTFKGVTTEVDRTDKSIQSYLLNLGEIEGVSGSMGAISETLAGKVSNLGDNYDRLLTTIGRSSIWGIAVDGLSGMLEVTNDLLVTTPSLIENIGSFFSALTNAPLKLTTENFNALEEALGRTLKGVEIAQIRTNGFTKEQKEAILAIKAGTYEANANADANKDEADAIDETTESTKNKTEATKEQIEAYHALGRKARAEIDAIASIEKDLFDLKPSGLPTGSVGMEGEDPAIQEGIDQMEELIQKSVRVQEELAYAAEIGNVFGGVLQNAFEASLINSENFFDVLADGLKKMIAQLAAAAATAAILAGILGIFGIGGGFTKAFGTIFSGGGGGGGGTAGSFGGLFQLRGTDLVSSGDRTTSQQGRF
jgi:phage tail tape-measure protein